MPQSNFIEHDPMGDEGRRAILVFAKEIARGGYSWHDLMKLVEAIEHIQQQMAWHEAERQHLFPDECVSKGEECATGDA